MILVLCAMKEEVSEIALNIKGSRKITLFRLDFYEGTLSGKKIVVGRTGVGKVMSAMVTQKLIDLYKPDAVIFSGIAGAVNPDLEVGDIVISRDCLQHDFDASSIGLKIGEIPFTGIRIIESDPVLLKAAESFVSSGTRVIQGRILTGDQFIMEKSEEKRRFFTEELGGDAVEMEGAAVGFVAKMNNIPFILVRIISDKADGNAPSNFNSFLHSSSEKISGIVKHILEKLDN